MPAVLVGSFLSSRAPDRYIRPIITFVIFASGLKYVGVGTTALGWILCVVAAGRALAAPPWLAAAALAGAGRRTAPHRRLAPADGEPRPPNGPGRGAGPDELALPG